MLAVLAQRVSDMTLEPLVSAPLTIQLHAVAALLAAGLGTLQLASRKGTARHRWVGYGWAGLMLVVAVSGLFIHTIRVVGPFSPIHILSLVILVSVPLALWHVRSGNVAAHAKAMQSVFWLALVVAGLFTLLPGRIMHHVIFGP